MQLCHCGCSVMNAGGFLLYVKDMWSPQILGICRYHSYEMQLQQPTTKTFQNPLLCLCSSAFGSCAELRQRAMGTGYPKQRLLQQTGTTTGSPKATKISSTLKPLEVQPYNLRGWVSLCQPLGFQIEH